MASRTDKPAGRPAEPPATEQRFTGRGACAGIAIGTVWLTVEGEPDTAGRMIAAAEVEPELARLDRAVARSLGQLAKLGARLTLLPEDSQRELSPLLDAYRQMLSSSRLLRGIRRHLADRLVSAERAVAGEVELIAGRMLALPEEDGASLERRAEEVREIGRRLLRNLAEAPFRKLSDLPHGAILVADRLRPADVALLDPTRVAGIVTEEGGAADHTAIMLAALGIPAVMAAAGIGEAVRAGATMVVDGSVGVVVLDPLPATLAEARRQVAAHARARQRLGRLRRLPAELASGEGIELQSNLDLPAELPLIVQSGAAGIGLLRSEFLFIAAETVPDEEAQALAYREIVRAMAGDVVTIRLLDWGGEKESPALEAAGLVPREREANPAMGKRGLRLLLGQPALLETQFSAILSVANEGPVRILLPMVTTLAEFRAARAVLDRVARRRRRRGEKMPHPLPPLGAMVETPGAALMADALALEADFLSIGTNDLTMYALAVDRGSSEVASLYDPLHPAVLRLIAETTEAALRLRKPVSICGELAGNPQVAPLLLGLGLRSFSMNASAIPRVKQVIRSLQLEECIRFARRVMEQTDPARIAELVSGRAGTGPS